MGPQEVPTTAFVLSLVAGVLFLVGASAPLVFMGSFGRMGGMMEDFRLAVVEGKHPNGETLSSDMPRWNISDADLRNLAEFEIPICDSGRRR